MSATLCSSPLAGAAAGSWAHAPGRPPCGPCSSCCHAVSMEGLSPATQRSTAGPLLAEWQGGSARVWRERQRVACWLHHPGCGSSPAGWPLARRRQAPARLLQGRHLAPPPVLALMAHLACPQCCPCTGRVRTHVVEPGCACCSGTAGASLQSGPSAAHALPAVGTQG